MDEQKCSGCKGRPRSATSKSAILNATLRLLEEKPLREMTIEAIAQKACVGKATIYKWWPNKAYLALEAFLCSSQTNVEIPDTGSAREDFKRQLNSLICFYHTKAGHIFCQFFAEGQADPKFAESFRKLFLSVRREDVKTILHRGVKRGEIRGDLDAGIVLDLFYAPIVYRLLAGHEPLNNDEAEKIVNAVFDGIEKRQD